MIIDSPERPSGEPFFAGTVAMSVRLGFVEYLNARPLVAGLDRDPRFVLSEEPPSRLADALMEGSVDFGLVPVVTLLRAPDLTYVPGLVIGADGDVDSVNLYLRESSAGPNRPWRVLLDRHSRTSQILSRIHLEEFERMPPEMLRYEEGDPRDVLVHGRRPEIDAVLMIGDQALRHRICPGFRTIDLAGSWTKHTGLPFVFAAWIARKDVLRDHPEVPGALTEALARGEAAIDAIARAAAPGHGVSEEVAIHYLRRRIAYRMTARHEDGMAAFLAKASRILEKK